MVPTPLEILALEPSPLGMLCLRRRELASRPGTFVTEITLDHEVLMSSLLTASERALGSSGLAWHGGTGQRVLVGGLGLGATAHEALAEPRVASVEVLELLPQVCAWLDRGLFPLAAELSADPRLTVVEGDAYGHLLGPPTRSYDLVLIDVDHSPDEPLGTESARFYSAEGLTSAAAWLAPGGVLGVWSYAEAPAFEEVLRKVFAEVRVEPVTFDNLLLDEDQTDWLYFARGPRGA